MLKVGNTTGRWNSKFILFVKYFTDTVSVGINSVSYVARFSVNSAVLGSNPSDLKGAVDETVLKWEERHRENDLCRLY